jgi:hypothetical protein
LVLSVMQTASATSAASAAPPDAERITLLDKARVAFAAGNNRGQEERAQRVLQRLWRLTDPASLPSNTHSSNAAAAATAAAAAGSVAASSTAAVAAPVIPVVAPPPASKQPSLTEHGSEGAGWTLPLLSDELAAASAAVAATVASRPALPSPTQPPLFLVLNNLGLVHLRAGRVAISCIFFARALEHVQQLLASIAPPALPTIAAANVANDTVSPRAAASTAAKQLPPSDGRLLSPTASSRSPTFGSRTLHGSSISISSAGGFSVPPSAASDGSLSLYSFLLVKSLDVFYNTAVALLHRHAFGAATELKLADDAQSSPSTHALTLAARCLRHCLDLPNNPAWSLLPPSLRAGASQKLLFAPVRLAECLLLYHRDRVTSPHTGALPPLLQAPAVLSSTAVVDALGDSAAGDLPLTVAVAPLRQLIAALRIDGASYSQLLVSASDSPLRSLRQQATLLLSEAHLLLQDGASALLLLQQLLADSSDKMTERKTNSPSFAHPPLSTLQRLQAELFMAEAFLLLQRPADALSILRGIREPFVREVLSSCGLAPSSVVAAIVGRPSLSAREQMRVATSVCAIAAHAFLAASSPTRYDEAAACVRMGRQLQPTDSRLLRLQLLLHVRQQEGLPALWLLKRVSLPSTPRLLTAS